jgi:hypothetical protein
MRRIVEAIFYIMRAGCAWDMLPDGFPPFLTVYRWWLLSGSGVVAVGGNEGASGVM